MTASTSIQWELHEEEEGQWWGSATLRPGVAAFGVGESRQEAFEDTRRGLAALISEDSEPLRALGVA